MPLSPRGRPLPEGPADGALRWKGPQLLTLGPCRCLHETLVLPRSLPAAERRRQTPLSGQTAHRDAAAHSWQDTTSTGRLCSASRVTCYAAVIPLGAWNPAATRRRGPEIGVSPPAAPAAGVAA